MVKLIIADDHVVLREALCEMLQSRGKCSVLAQASNGEELLRAISGSNPDVLVVDMQMPKMDGLASIEQLKNSNINIPILVLSADESERNVRAALKAGASGYIPKNVGVEELEFAIQSVLDGKTYLSPSVTTALMNGSGGGMNSGENPFSVLTPRELEVLKQLADGMPNRDIAKILHISSRTVDTHRSNILKKLNVKTNAELVKLSISSGLISV